MENENTNGLTDDILWSMIQEGNQLAFNRFYIRYWKGIFAYIYNIVNEKELAANILYEVFVKAWENKNTIQSCNFKNHLFESARQLSISSFRNLDENSLVERLIKVLLNKENLHLSKRCRTIFDMSFNKGYTSDEIAARFNISCDDVEDQLSFVVGHLIGKEESLELIEKLEQGISAETKKRILFYFCEKAQSENSMISLQLSEEDLSNTVLLRINKTNSDQESLLENGETGRLKLKVAVVIAGILILGYFFQKISKPNLSYTIPDNQITLQLGNGPIRIINEADTVRVLTQDGRYIGDQEGGRIVFNKVDMDSEIVYSTLTVPYGKEFEVRLSDESKVYLNSGTTLRYPINFVSGKNRNVYLKGEAFFEVERDSKNPFIVNSGSIDVEVLGTSFNVTSYEEDNEVEVVLVEGEVKMRKTGQKMNQTVLMPGFKGSYDKSLNTISTNIVKVSNYTSWMTGKLIFRNEQFKDIILKLERKYNIEIENENKELDTVSFSTTIDFEKESIEQVLDVFGAIYPMKYEIYKNKVTIL